VILKDHYYGHPNPIRAETDERQCRYRGIDEPSDEEYTAPIVVAPSSTGGVIEFQSDHFGYVVDLCEAPVVFCVPH